MLLNLINPASVTPNDASAVATPENSAASLLNSGQTFASTLATQALTAQPAISSQQVVQEASSTALQNDTSIVTTVTAPSGMAIMQGITPTAVAKGDNVISVTAALQQLTPQTYVTAQFRSKGTSATDLGTPQTLQASAKKTDVTPSKTKDKSSDAQVQTALPAVDPLATALAVATVTAVPSSPVLPLVYDQDSPTASIADAQDSLVASVVPLTVAPRMSTAQAIKAPGIAETSASVGASQPASPGTKDNIAQISTMSVDASVASVSPVASQTPQASNQHPLHEDTPTQARSNTVPAVTVTSAAAPDASVTGAPAITMAPVLTKGQLVERGDIDANSVSPTTKDVPVTSDAPDDPTAPASAINIDVVQGKGSSDVVTTAANRPAERTSPLSFANPETTPNVSQVNATSSQQTAPSGTVQVKRAVDTSSPSADAEGSKSDASSVNSTASTGADAGALPVAQPVMSSMVSVAQQSVAAASLPIAPNAVAQSPNESLPASPNDAGTGDSAPDAASNVTGPSSSLSVSTNASGSTPSISTTLTPKSKTQNVSFSASPVSSPVFAQQAHIAAPNDAAVVAAIPVTVSSTQGAISHSDSGGTPTVQNTAQPLPADVPAHVAGGTAMPALSSAQLIQSMHQTQMKVGLNSTEFGNLSISTSIANQTLTAQISTDHSVLGHVLSAQLPSIQEKLGDAYGLQTRVEIRDAGMQSGTNSGGSNEHRDGGRNASASTFAGSSIGGASLDSGAIAYSSMPSVSSNDGRLDITI